MSGSIGLVPTASSSDQIQVSQKDPNPDESEGSEFRNTTSVDDLPDGVLAEILCRLPCNKFVFRCKGVSKRWCTLVSDPHFIDQFVRIQSDRKIPIIRTLLNDEAEEFRLTMTAKEEEFLTTMNMKVEKSLPRMPSKPLTPLFERLMSCHSLDSEPWVVATCNDLVLCCESEVDQSEYFICNPYTIQWVSLPPPPRVYREVLVGFICDVDNAQQSCRCMVVRIPEEINQHYSFNLNVEIFSSETGKWRESIVTFTQEIDWALVLDTSMSYSMSYAYNGMLYWNLLSYFGNCFIGFDPFMINTTSSSDGIDHYKGRIIDFAPSSVEIDEIVCVGVYGGCLRFIGQFDLVSGTLPEWELEEEQDERAVDRSGNLILKCSKYSLDTQMFDGTNRNSYPWPIFDPNDEDILYLRNENVGNLKCNIRTGEWSKMPACMLNDNCIVWFQLITLPWWPTPIPRLSQDQHPHGASKQQDSPFRADCSFGGRKYKSLRTLVDDENDERPFNPYDYINPLFEVEHDASNDDDSLDGDLLLDEEDEEDVEE